MITAQEKLLNNPIILNFSRFSDNIVELFESFIFLSIRYDDALDGSVTTTFHTYDIQWHYTRDGNENKASLENSLAPFVKDIVRDMKGAHIPRERYGCFLVTLAKGERMFVDWMWSEKMLGRLQQPCGTGIIFAVSMLFVLPVI